MLTTSAPRALAPLHVDRDGVEYVTVAHIRITMPDVAPLLRDWSSPRRKGGQLLWSVTVGEFARAKGWPVPAGVDTSAPARDDRGRTIFRACDVAAVELRTTLAVAGVKRTELPAAA